MKKEFTAQEIINDLLLYDDPANTQAKLRELMDIYFLYNDNATTEEKERIYGCFLMFNELVERSKYLINRPPAFDLQETSKN